MADRIENEGFITLSSNIRNLIALAQNQKQKIQEQEAEIKALNETIAQLRAEEMRVSEELAVLKTAGSLQGSKASTEEAKAFIDDILADFRKSLELVQSLNVVDYKANK